MCSTWAYVPAAAACERRAKVGAFFFKGTFKAPFLVTKGNYLWKESGQLSMKQAHSRRSSGVRRRRARSAFALAASNARRGRFTFSASLSGRLTFVRTCSFSTGSLGGARTQAPFFISTCMLLFASIGLSWLPALAGDDAYLAPLSSPAVAAVCQYCRRAKKPRKIVLKETASSRRRPSFCSCSGIDFPRANESQMMAIMMGEIAQFGLVLGTIMMGFTVSFYALFQGDWTYSEVRDRWPAEARSFHSNTFCAWAVRSKNREIRSTHGTSLCSRRLELIISISAPLHACEIWQSVSSWCVP